MSVVRLILADNELEAEAICGLLRTEGIACDHRRAEGGTGWEPTGSGGAREVLVEEADLERARELVEPPEA
jgi:hypothetical protein